MAECDGGKKCAGYCANFNRRSEITQNSKSELYVKKDDLFNEIIELVMSTSGEAHKAYKNVINIISDMAVEVEPTRHDERKESIYFVSYIANIADETSGFAVGNFAFSTPLDGAELYRAVNKKAREQAKNAIVMCISKIG